MDRARPLMTLCAVTLDCADPASLARFYERATGLASVDGSGEDFAGLRGPGLLPGLPARPGLPGTGMAGTGAAAAVPLDFEVDDLDLVEAALLRHGAGKSQEQPNDERWRVLTHPAGHPFCLTTSRTVRK